jgi:hypothetical protein
MSISLNTLTVNNSSTSNETVSSFLINTTVGTSGFALTSQGSALPASWSTRNPYNQTLNTTSTPTFSSLTTGSNTLPTTNGTANQYLQSQGGSTPSWSIPKTNVVSATTTSNFTPTTSNNTSTKNWSAFTGLSVTITPLSTTSKILLMAHLGNISNPGGSVQAYTTIYNNSTDLSSNAGMNYAQITESAQWPIYCCYVDSPATTSAITYAIYCCNVGSASGVFNSNNLLISLVAYEI